MASRIFSLPLCLIMLVVTAHAQVTLTFEEFPTETRVSELYAPQSIHFLNDFQPGAYYHASPLITPHPNATSPGNVLVNDQYNCELMSSANAALVFWFDQPVTNVSMYLGTIRDLPGQCSCLSTPLASISFRDCYGYLLTRFYRIVSTSFNTFIAYTNAEGRIRQVEIDYGNTNCPEAIDDLTFTMGTGICADLTPPVIVITSHTNDQVVNNARQKILGYVEASGPLRLLLLNGTETPFYQGSDGRYYFNATVFLQEGNNTVTFIAQNASGMRNTAQLRLFLGTPVSATVTSFHLTQRGVMLDQACDIDEPLVVGKSTLVRISLKVQTSTGMETYASSVKMKVWRRLPWFLDQLVGTFSGTTYSPSTSYFTSPSDLAAIHFWIPGYTDTFDVADDYRFTFEAYVGSTQIGPPLSTCGWQYVEFKETKPIRLLILPVERVSGDPVFNGTNQLRDFYQQLYTVARVFPVRDGVRRLGVQQPGGLIFDEVHPLRLCDGTAATTHLEHCGGTGWTWKFIDKDPSGILRRANDHIVTDSSNNAICGDNRIIGGRIVNNSTFTFNFDPDLGIFLVAGIPRWNRGGKHVTPLDQDHDGDIDEVDLSFYAAEFLDKGTFRWTTDFNFYNQGETFRNFQDLNGNFCHDSGEPQSLAMQRNINEKEALLSKPAREALIKRNKGLPGTSDFEYASLWFPGPLFAPSRFGAFGSGQGKKKGWTSWIHVTNLMVMAHELGHNFGLSGQGCYGGMPEPCDLTAIENAWAIYINGQSITPDQVFEVMDESGAPGRQVFSKKSYQVLFNKLQVSSSSALAAYSLADVAGDQLVVNGLLYDDGHVDRVTTSLSTGLDPTPVVSTSPYSLVLGRDCTILDTVRFAPDPPLTEPQGEQYDPTNYTTFYVVTAFPSVTEWVEIRKADQTLAHFDRSFASPAVAVVSPNGGESFGATQRVTIQWLAGDADSTDLWSSVYYSPDQGENWLLLAAALRGNSFLWDTVSSPGASDQGLIRVVVCDGFNSGEDVSDDTFTVAGKPPSVVIIAPRPGQTNLQCARAIIRGLALDLDGPINSVRWSVDRTIVATELETQLEPLPPGPHTLRLEAFDADGESAIDEVTFQVLADSDCDGMSDDFENQYGLNEGSVNDAGEDNDMDSLFNFDEAVAGTDPTNPDTDADNYPDGMEVDVRSNPLDHLNTPFTTGIFNNVLYVNCGGGALLDTLGRLWRPDAPFLVTTQSNTDTFTGTVDVSLLGDKNVPQEMLLSERYKQGDLNYQIPVSKGLYAVVLYFSENCLTCVNPNLGGTGYPGRSRYFDILVEYQHLGIYNPADAAEPPPNDGFGATFKATQVVLPDVYVYDGVLNVSILDRGIDNPPGDPAIKGMTIFRKSNITIDLDLSAGWSLISLPLKPYNITDSELLSEAVVVYGYEKQIGHVRITKEEDLETGSGYWILLNEPKTFTITGEIIENYHLSIKNGWYMIGGCTYPAQASVDNGSIKVIYDYSQEAGYQQILESEGLKHGKGYWILSEDISDQANLNVQGTMK